MSEDISIHKAKKRVIEEFEYEPGNVLISIDDEDKFLVIGGRKYDFSVNEPSYRSWSNPESHRKMYSVTENRDHFPNYNANEIFLQRNYELYAEDIDDVQDEIPIREQGESEQ
jgi:hypothetical protein